MSDVLGDLGEAVVLIRADSASLLDEMKGLRGDLVRQADTAGEGMSLAFAGWAKDLVEKGVQALEELGDKLVEVVGRGAQLSDLRDNFERLTSAIGVDATAAINALRTGTHGLVDDFQLMQQANKLMSSGMHLTAADMQTVAAASRDVAKATGKDTAEAFDIVSQALVTGRARMLQAAGVSVELKGASNELTQQLKSEGAEMSSSADIATKRKAVMEALNAIVKQSGTQEDNLREKVLAGKIALSNLVDEIGEAIARSPVLGAGFDAIEKSLLAAFGGNKETLIRTVVHAIEDTAIVLVNAAEVGVKFGKYVGDAFLGLDVVGAQMYADLSAGALKTGESLQALLAIIAIMPDDVGKAARAGLPAMNVAVETLRSVTKGYTDEVDESKTKLGEWNSTMDTAAGALDTAKKAMLAAKAAGDGQLDTTKKLTGATSDLGEATGQLTEQDKILAQLAEGLNVWQKMEILGYQKLGLSVDDTAKKMHLYSAVVQKFLDDQKKGLKDEEDAIKAQAEAEKQYEQADAETNKQILKNIDIRDSARKKSQDEIDKRTMTSYDYQRQQVAQWVEDERNKLDYSVQGWDEAWDAIDQAAKDSLDDIADQEKRAGDAAVVAATSTKSAWQDAIDSIPEMFAQAMQGGGGFKGFGIAVTGKLTNGIEDAIAHTKMGGAAWENASEGVGKLFGTKAGTAFGKFAGSGAASSLAVTFGEQMVKSKSVIGSTLSGAAMGTMIMPGIGTAIGAGVGALVGGIKHFMSHQGRDAVVDFADQFGGFDKLHDQLATLGDQGEKLWKQLTQGTNKRDSEQAQKNIDAVTDAFNKQAEQAAEDQKELAGLSTAAQGLNTMASALGSSLADTMAAQDKAAQDAAGAAGDSIDGVTAATYKGTEDQEAAWDRLGTFALATFGGIVSKTGDVIGALQQIGPTLDILQAGVDKFGFKGNEATDQLLRMYKTVTNNADVFTDLSGLSQLMSGLGDAMLTTGDVGQAFGDAMAADFKTLTDRGVDATEALADMQPQLQKLWQLQKDGKITVDDTTQAMLDQAEQAGIVGDKQKDINQKTLDVLVAIARVFKADIPDGLDETAKKVGQLGGAIDGLSQVHPHIDISYSYNQDGGGPAPPDVSVGNGGGDIAAGVPDGTPELATGGYANWGMGSLAVLHGYEAVMPLDRLQEMIGDASPAMDAEALTNALMAAGIGRPNINFNPDLRGTLAKDQYDLAQQLWPAFIRVLQDSGTLNTMLGNTIGVDS